MKSILIVTQQFMLGGLETHIRGEIQQLSAMGVNVHLATGQALDNVLLPTELKSITAGIALEPSASAHQTWTAINQIRQIIHQHGIDHLHIHPFTSIVAAATAAEIENIPYALTLHGPDSLGSFYGPTFDILLKDVVLPRCSAVVAVSPEVKQLASAYAAIENIHYIPNTVSFDQSPEINDPISTALQGDWLVVSRLDDAKIPGIYDFCVKAKNSGIQSISIAGNGPAQTALTEQLQQQGLSDFVRFLGGRSEISNLMQQASGVAGMGRVLLEGVAAQKPVVLIGYDGVKGLLDRDLFARAATANFSGRGLPTIDQQSLNQQLASNSQSEEVTQLYAMAEAGFNETSAWPAFYQLLNGAMPPQPSLLSGLYTCLQSTPAIDESPYLTSTDFLSKLEIISCQNKYYEPRLFTCISMHMRHLEQVHLNRVITERDGQVAHLQNAIANCDAHIESLKQMMATCNDDIKHLSQGMAERDEHISVLANRLTERDGHITLLTNGMTERDGHITLLTNSMAERDDNISNLNQGLTARDEKINELTLAVSDLSQRISGLNQDIYDRDGQLNQLNKLAATHHQEIQNIHYSASWRLTYPLRLSYSVVSKLGTPLFLRLPLHWRQAVLNKVNPAVHPTTPQPGQEVQQLANIPNLPPLQAHTDLSWTEFSQQVLSRRAQYKGIFVQEIVIDWNVPLYQRPQHMSVAMARLGYLVIYRTANWTADNVNGFREVEKDVWVTNCDEVDSIDDVIRSLYSTAYSNSVDNILKNGARGQIIYEYIDHIDPEISGDDENIKRLTLLRNFAFSGGADYVVASAQKLFDEAAESVGTSKTIMVQNGVDTRHYRNPKHKTQALPATLTDFKKKFKHIVGYFGALAPWLWYETISDLVQKKSDVGFVFIGPDYYGGVEKLPQAENVIYLGSVDYKILPAYAMTFDVCFIPFKPGDIAKSTSPLKLFEYFALEKPVVVTSDMLECTRYPEVFHGDSAEALSVAIDKALAIKDNPSFKGRLSQLADENNWDKRAESLIAGLKN